MRSTWPVVPSAPSRAKRMPWAGPGRAWSPRHRPLACCRFRRAVASWAVSFDRPSTAAQVEVVGTEGWVALTGHVLNRTDPTQLLVCRAGATEPVVETFAPQDPYRLEVEHLSAAVRDEVDLAWGLTTSEPTASSLRPSRPRCERTGRWWSREGLVRSRAALSEEASFGWAKQDRRRVRGNHRYGSGDQGLPQRFRGGERGRSRSPRRGVSWCWLVRPAVARRLSCGWSPVWRPSPAAPFASARRWPTA